LNGCKSRQSIFGEESLGNALNALILPVPCCAIFDETSQTSLSGQHVGGHG